MAVKKANVVDEAAMIEKIQDKAAKVKE